MNNTIASLIAPPARDPNVEEVIKAAILELPDVPLSAVDPKDHCGVCLTTYEELFGEVAQYAAKKKEKETMEEGKDKDEEETIDENAPGLTKVAFCGHIYCRRDLIGWIRQTPPNGTCPLCRHPFIELPVADDESSDGGEYVPNPDDLEDDATDGYSDDLDPLAPSEQDDLYRTAAEAAFRAEFPNENEEMDELERAERRAAAQAAAFRAEFPNENEEMDEQERADEEAAARAAFRAEFPQENEEWDAQERAEQEAAELREEFAEELAEEEAEELAAELRAEYADAIAGGEAQELTAALREEQERRDDFRAYFTEDECGSEPDGLIEAVRGLQSRVRETQDHVSVLRARISRIQSEYGESEIEMDTEDDSAPHGHHSIGSDALMDVCDSDSSSDLDYEPEDYLMSDTDTEMSSDFDYSIEELDCLDKDDPVAIHSDSSSDSLLAMAALPEDKTLPSVAATASGSGTEENS